MIRNLRIVLVVGVVAGVTTLGGCKKEAAPPPAKPGEGKGPTAAGPLQGVAVGFVQVGAESSWRTAETKSIQDEAARRGCDLKFADGQGKQANQIKALRSFVNQKVDVIVLAPIVETGWDEVLGRAKKAGIPVILVDRGVKVADESLYTTKIASDFVFEGRLAGEWLAKKLSGKGSIAELRGTEGAAPAIDRKKGFEEAIAKHPDLKIVLTETGKFERAEGKKVMKTFLDSGTKIDAVYAHNDDMALGAIQAIEEKGLKPGQDIILISIDAVRGAFEAMKQGNLNATVECSPYLGPVTFDMVEKVLAGKKVPHFLQVKDRLFEPAEAESVLADWPRPAVAMETEAP